MKKLKGPDLKMPELKVPALVADLYHDLRDRRLLPVVALVAVAIVAVPFLLGGGEVTRPPASRSAGVALAPYSNKASTLTVVEAKPGLRNYHERLGDRTPTNPFKQRYTSLPDSAQVESLGGGAGGAGGGSSTVSVGAGDTTDAAEGGVQSGGGGDDGGGGGGAQPPRLIDFVIDVQISHTETTADGQRVMGEPEVRRHVRSLRQLPGEKTPVVTTGGVNLRNGKVVFLVSDDVKSLEGEFKCLTRTPTGICELLEIESGFPLELVYGPDDALYRIKVIKIDAIWAGRVGDQRSSRAAFVGLRAAVLPTP